MIEPEVLFIIPLAFIGFVLKGIATFGPGIVMVPAGALVFGARDMVLLSGCLDLISNLSLYKPRASHFRNPFWSTMISAMAMGAVLGALLLTCLPLVYFDLVIGALLLPVGLWIIFSKNQLNAQSNDRPLPDLASTRDISVSLLSGVMSGLSGITAPVLAWYFNRRYNKQAFRHIMIPLLLASAFSRVTAYAFSGALTIDILPLILLSIPGLIIGLWLGNRLFLKIPQKWFGNVIGSLVSLSGIKLLFR